MNNREIGNLGETIATSYILDKGLKLLTKNYIKNKGEIDIIANDNETIVFIEVKFRNSLKYGHPLESINYKKISKLRETASYYLNEFNLNNYNIRFDVISILFENGTYNIEYIKNAF